MVKEKLSRKKQQEQGTEEKQGLSGTARASRCLLWRALEYGCGIGWWPIKEGLECQSKGFGFYSEARRRRWGDMSRAVLQEDKSVSSFEM